MTKEYTGPWCDNKPCNGGQAWQTDDSAIIDPDAMFCCVECADEWVEEYRFKMVFDTVLEELQDRIFSDIKYTCDCCTRGFDYPNIFGLCQCWCNKCGREQRDCKYTCCLIKG